MVINNLVLKNFRNHSYRNFDFKEGLNLITGENAIGKTNIIEAIYYLSLAKSFRTSEDNDLILKGGAITVNQENSNVLLGSDNTLLIKSFVFSNLNSESDKVPPFSK